MGGFRVKVSGCLRLGVCVCVCVMKLRGSCADGFEVSELLCCLQASGKSS